jgi:hypothetical protein
MHRNDVLNGGRFRRTRRYGWFGWSWNGGNDEDDGHGWTMITGRFLQHFFRLLASCRIHCYTYLYLLGKGMMVCGSNDLGFVHLAFCSSFHFFFCTDAAVLLPKMKAEVRLSAPVRFDLVPGPPNTTCGFLDECRGTTGKSRPYRPQSPETNGGRANQGDRCQRPNIFRVKRHDGRQSARSCERA